MTYDMIRLFEHELRFRGSVPYAIVTFGGSRKSGTFELDVEWKPSQMSDQKTARLQIRWDVETLRLHHADLEEELEIARTRDENQTVRIEQAAIVVAVAAMSFVEPQTRFTSRSRIGTGHDFGLNSRHDEMIEIAGRTNGSLTSLFKAKREQSDKNPTLRKRWVSVTVFGKSPRNRTEGLHL